MNHDYFSYQVVYEGIAGPGQYLTLVHARYKVNNTVRVTE